VGGARLRPVSWTSRTAGRAGGPRARAPERARGGGAGAPGRPRRRRGGPPRSEPAGASAAGGRPGRLGGPTAGPARRGPARWARRSRAVEILRSAPAPGSSARRHAPAAVLARRQESSDSAVPLASGGTASAPVPELLDGEAPGGHRERRDALGPPPPGRRAAGAPNHQRLGRSSAVPRRCGAPERGAEHALARLAVRRSPRWPAAPLEVGVEPAAEELEARALGHCCRCRADCRPAGPRGREELRDARGRGSRGPGSRLRSAST